MSTLEEAKRAVIEDFSMYDEWLDKYEYLIELGKNLEPYPEEEKTEEKLIKGCQSRVWLDSRIEGGKLFFKADSDAIITKGIISLLIGVYSGRDPKEIAEDDFGFIAEIGLKENLSPTRANGLVSMIERIKELAKSAIVTDTQDVLTAEDAKELAPLYDNVVLALKLVINKKHEAFIKMTFTAPTCPMADEVLSEVKKNVADVPGITACEVELTFDPPWDQSMLSEEARVDLGLDG